MGTVFATGMAWLEQFVALDGGAGTLLVIAGTIGPDIFPVVIGQFLEDDPMVLVHAQFGVILACVVLFVFVYLLARGRKKL